MQSGTAGQVDTALLSINVKGAEEYTRSSGHVETGIVQTVRITKQSCGLKEILNVSFQAITL